MTSSGLLSQEGTRLAAARSSLAPAAAPDRGTQLDINPAIGESLLEGRPFAASWHATMDTLMQSRRGVFRLWVLLSLIGYMSFVGYWLINLPDAPWRQISRNPSRTIVELPASPTYPQTWAMVLIAVGVPAIALGLGLVTAWVIEGFRTPTGNPAVGAPPLDRLD
jgi:hypothetical protein